MKRDMELIRAILLKVEESDGFGPDVTIPGFTPEQIGYHNYLLVDAGLAMGTDITHMGSQGREYMITDLTWAGHDFLDAARDSERWGKAQTVFSKMGGVTLDVAKSVLTTLMTQQANALLGTN